MAFFSLLYCTAISISSVRIWDACVSDRRRQQESDRVNKSREEQEKRKEELQWLDYAYELFRITRNWIPSLCFSLVILRGGGGYFWPIQKVISQIKRYASTHCILLTCSKFYFYFSFFYLWSTKSRIEKKERSIMYYFRFKTLLPTHTALKKTLHMPCISWLHKNNLWGKPALLT